MPKAIIHTNLASADVPEGFELRLAQKLSEVFKFPLELIHVSLTTGDRMCHNGSTAPLVFVDITVVSSKFSETKNPEYSKIFLPFVGDKLKIPINRVLVVYHGKEMYELGVERLPPEYKEEMFFLDPMGKTGASRSLEHYYQLIHVSLTTGDRMCHNGSTAPLVFVDITVVSSKFSETKNPEYSKIFLPFVGDKLKIPINRVLVVYHGKEMYELGVERLPPEYKEEMFFLDPMGKTGASRSLEHYYQE